MNSLRQEIKNALDNFYGELEGVSVPPIMKAEHEKHTNEILKIFEKRIDSLNGKYLPYCLTLFQFVHHVMVKSLGE